MKKLLLTLTCSVALTLVPTGYAIEKKEKAPKTGPTTTATTASGAPTARAAMPFYTTADEINATARVFFHNNKDGRKVKHTLAATAEVKQGEAVAKFEDIKVGDTVSGMRLKKNEDGTEYEVLKITKFEAKPEKSSAKKK